MQKTPVANAAQSVLNNLAKPCSYKRTDVHRAKLSKRQEPGEGGKLALISGLGVFMFGGVFHEE